MSETLKDKVILVTGAGRGVGRDISILAASEGARVVVNDLGVQLDGEGSDDTPAMEVVNTIKGAGGDAVANYDSVADWDAAHNMVRQAVDTFGRLDGVVNNAGILRDVIFHKMTEADWDSVINVHLKGTFNVSRAAAALFRKQESGSMVHMTSTSGLIGAIGQANYAAAKLGIAALSRSIAIEMGRYNVRSNAIAPFAFSRMTDSIPTDTEAGQARMERIKKMGAEKVAPLVVALLSDKASNVSGQIFSARANELFLFNQPRPVRAVHRNDGWTPKTVLEQALPAMSGNFTPLERSPEVFCWDPI